jgi:glycosyltransferase involved in cell wall biosynthesis
MTKKVVFVTSAQPSANPRMVKSVVSLSSRGFDVTVIYARIAHWATFLDNELFKKENKIKWVGVGLTNNKSILNYYFRARQKCWKLFNFLTGLRFIRSAKSFTMYSQELTFMALRYKADLYIGHNLGALSAVVKAAEKHGVRAIFDFEDYYSGEFCVSSFESKLITEYERSYVPKIAYATVSSPLIRDLYKTIYPNFKSLVLLNVFSIKFRSKEIICFRNVPLKLFWFSQFVGLERGLQNVIKSISYFEKGQIQFTILGNCDCSVKESLLSLATELNLAITDLQFLHPVSEFEIFKLMTTHHIGIASEVPTLLNRDLCLTNKLFCYLLSGLALVSSNTRSQSSFLKQHTEIGFTYDYDNHDQLVHIFKTYIHNPDLLHKHRVNALSLATETYNWEYQSSYWTSLIDNLVNS